MREGSKQAIKEGRKQAMSDKENQKNKGRSGRICYVKKDESVATSNKR